LLKSKKIRSILLFLLLFLNIIIIFIPTIKADSYIVDINGGGDYTSIQEAINNANTGDTINIWDGIYIENVEVNKSVNIVGNSSDNTFVVAYPDMITYSTNIDNYCWHSNQATWSPDCFLRLNNSDYYMGITCASDGDGFVHTFHVWDNNGTIEKNIIDYYEFDTDSGKQGMLCHINGNVYAVVYANDAHAEDDPEFKAWPKHCVAGTEGAEVVKELVPRMGDLVIPKQDLSVFTNREADRLLREAEIHELYVTGVATEYCVRGAALDALTKGYKVNVVVDAIAGVDLKKGDQARALLEMGNTGAKPVYTKQVLEELVK